MVGKMPEELVKEAVPWKAWVPGSRMTLGMSAMR